MDRRGFLRAMGLVCLAGSVPTAATLAAESRSGETRTDDEKYAVIQVPQDYSTIQAGVDAAAEGDLVLVAEGTYPEAVLIQTPGITLRGRDRNGVIVEGEFNPGHGIDVEADGVAVENLTVRHFQSNAVYWTGVEGFRGSYLTAYNNGYYGIYAVDSTDGRFEYCYASGHPDAGFYLGHRRPFEATVTDVVAEYNGLGYSGTSTGAGITVRDSIWRHNMVGIVPNTLSDDAPPQRRSRITGNVVYGNGNENAPIVEYAYGMFGTGILLWGGNENVVEDNVVENHPNFGIAVTPSAVEPSGNQVQGNAVSDSGRADLALGAPAGDGNHFEDNQFATSMPENIEGGTTEGSERVTDVYDRQEQAASDGEYPAGDWREQPVPGDLPTMPDPEAPPIPATKSSSWGANGGRTGAGADR